MSRVRMSGLVKISLLGVVVAGALAIACHANVDITFDNRTGVDLLVNVNRSGFERIGPGEETISYLIDDDANMFIVTVTTTDGTAIFEQTYTREQLSDREDTIVLEEALLPTSSLGRR